jgi:hypothetical protein
MNVGCDRFTAAIQELPVDLQDSRSVSSGTSPASRRTTIHKVAGNDRSINRQIP